MQNWSIWGGLPSHPFNLFIFFLFFYVFNIFIFFLLKTDMCRILSGSDVATT
jgi:hypothetical protein